MVSLCQVGEAAFTFTYSEHSESGTRLDFSSGRHCSLTGHRPGLRLGLLGVSHRTEGAPYWSFNNIWQKNNFSEKKVFFRFIKKKNYELFNMNFIRREMDRGGYNCGRFIWWETSTNVFLLLRSVHRQMNGYLGCCRLAWLTKRQVNASTSPLLISDPRMDQEQPCLASKETQRFWAGSHGAG